MIVEFWKMNEWSYTPAGNKCLLSGHVVQEKIRKVESALEKFGIRGWNAPKIMKDMGFSTMLIRSIVFRGDPLLQSIVGW